MLLSPLGERSMSSSRVKELRSRQRVRRKPVGHLEVEPGASPALTPSCSSPPWGRGWVRGSHEPPEPPHLTSPPAGERNMTIRDDSGTLGQRFGRKPVGHLEVEPGASPALTPSCSSPPWG